MTDIDALADGRIVRYQYRELLSPGMARLLAAVIGASVVLFTVMGPLGTSYALDTIPRAAFWAVHATLSSAVCYSQCVVTMYLARRRSPYEIALAVGATAPLLALPCASVTFVVYELFTGSRLGTGRFADVYRTTTALVLVVQAAVHYVLRRRIKPSPVPAAEGDVEEPCTDPAG